jgi:hypothetical protein
MREINRNAGRRASARRRAEAAAARRSEAALRDDAVALAAPAVTAPAGVRVRACVVVARVRGSGR